eukprot:2906711-Rhodomonas_salina.1
MTTRAGCSTQKVRGTTGVLPTMLNTGEARHAASTEASGTNEHLRTTPRPTSTLGPAKSFNP